MSQPPKPDWSRRRFIREQHLEKEKRKKRAEETQWRRDAQDFFQLSADTYEPTAFGHKFYHLNQEWTGCWGGIESLARRDPALHGLEEWLAAIPFDEKLPNAKIFDHLCSDACKESATLAEFAPNFMRTQQELEEYRKDCTALFETYVPPIFKTHLI